MLLVNLFGQPGAGKSTGSAYIFSQLKMRGVNSELVTEFAKDKVWEESKEVFRNQAYIFGKQYFRISRVENKVDLVVTDSPIVFSSFYNNDPLLGKEFDDFVLKVFNHFNNLNVYVKRVKPYEKAGRFQTEEESDKVGEGILKFLDERDIKYMTINGDLNGYNALISLILQKLGLSNSIAFNPGYFN